ncbi:UPF0287-domain-containing protein [Dacryopinax primogenitus]|uniref:COX assembly mitochondrial protein n=1 Tax=Dacryopinax primogenitus (strain DJM 731) TaxID=1858805 RepID=M5FYA4_DACPD|nr:UPF0287-domain-containing protein [Dacryopinax primogenitus]EJU00805.1 UPF0287-domain-containing protein [Dacryopinax primogenitus]
MHPHLATPERQLVCGDFIQALERCHASGWWFRYTGGCNEEKDALRMCLRQERIDRTQKNLENARLRRASSQQAWQEMQSD